MQLLTSTLSFRCFTPMYKEYSIWENIEFSLMLISIATLYVGMVYYSLYLLKLITDKLKKYFK